MVDVKTTTIVYLLILISKEKTYYHQNAHGDVILLTDEMGAVLRSYEYDAFGREWGALDTDNNPFRYCGEYFDKQTETVYLRARYYDSAYGRFTQQDGWEYANFGDPLSLNLYTYCWNNPVLYADPSGHYTNNGEPPPPSSGYIPGKNGPQYNREKNGWIDKNGNIWRPDRVNHGRNRDTGDNRHWDVQRPDGKGYINVGADGKKWGGKGIAPNIPNDISMPNNNINIEGQPNQGNEGNLGVETFPVIDGSGGKEYVPNEEPNNNGLVDEPIESTDRYEIVINPPSDEETAIVVLVLVGVALYQVIKWGVAISLAPTTGGVSLIGAAAMP